MKAFLMYRDRDFDPGQLLSRRENELHRRNPDPSLDLRQLLPWNEATLTQDLGLETVFDAIGASDKFISEVARVAILSGVTDPDTILYRQRILVDCIKNESIVREIYQIAIEAIANERKNYWSYFSRYPSGIVRRSVDVLQMFVGMLRRLRRAADERAGEFASDGFARLFDMLKAELGDDYFARVERHLRQLQFRNGVLISAGRYQVPRICGTCGPWKADDGYRRLLLCARRKRPRRRTTNNTEKLPPPHSWPPEQLET